MCGARGALSFGYCLCRLFTRHYYIFALCLFLAPHWPGNPPPGEAVCRGCGIAAVAMVGSSHGCPNPSYCGKQPSFPDRPLLDVTGDPMVPMGSSWPSGTVSPRARMATQNTVAILKVDRFWLNSLGQKC